MRLTSILIGLLTLWILHRLLTTVFPKPSAIPCISVGWMAFLPGFTSTSSTITNDGLAAAFGTGIIACAVRMTRDQPRLLQWAMIGAVAGFGTLTKLTVLPVALACVPLLVWFHRRNWRRATAGLAMFLLCFTAISGWWFVRNWQLYGDPIAINVFLANKTVMHSSEILQWSYLGTSLHRIFNSYWTRVSILGVAINIWLCRSLYLVTAAGAILAATWFACHWRHLNSQQRKQVLILLFALAANCAALARAALLGAGAEGRYLYPTLATQSCFAAWALVCIGQFVACRPARTARICLWAGASLATMLCLFHAPFLHIMDEMVFTWCQMKPRAMGVGFYLEQGRLLYVVILSAVCVLTLAATLWLWFAKRRQRYDGIASSSDGRELERFAFTIGSSICMAALNLLILAGHVWPAFHPISSR